MSLPRRKSAVPHVAEMCPVGSCMQLLAGAWTPNIIWHLSAGARRFSELQADMKPISAKVLSQRLKELEYKGVLSRAVLDTSPPSVEYALTELGRELAPAIEAIARVGYKLRQHKLGQPMAQRQHRLPVIGGRPRCERGRQQRRCNKST